MKLLVDMNLSPGWVSMLGSYGWTAQHWSAIGQGNAPDAELLSWAREQGYVVLTQDLDFSQLLFATRERGPSVVLLRLENEFDEASRRHVCATLKLAEQDLVAGALLTVTSKRARLRRLPIDP